MNKLLILFTILAVGGLLAISFAAKTTKESLMVENWHCAEWKSEPWENEMEKKSCFVEEGYGNDGLVYWRRSK